jgi:hypothetical protein
LGLDAEREFLHVREIKPKDFYLAASLQDREESLTSLVLELILNPQVLEQYNLRETRHFLKWLEVNEIRENIMGVQSWLELALYLNKGKWDQSVDWLEEQPLSKIRVFAEASNSYNNKKKNGK